MMECRAVGETEKGLSRTSTDTRARSLKGKTLGSFSATCVARLAQKGVVRFGMSTQSTFQEVTSISVTNVTGSLTPTTNGAIIAQACTPARSQSECDCFTVKTAATAGKPSSSLKRKALTNP